MHRIWILKFVLSACVHNLPHELTLVCWLHAAKRLKLYDENFNEFFGRSEWVLTSLKRCDVEWNCGFKLSSNFKVTSHWTFPVSDICRAYKHKLVGAKSVRKLKERKQQHTKGETLSNFSPKLFSRSWFSYFSLYHLFETFPIRFLPFTKCFYVILQLYDALIHLEENSIVRNFQASLDGEKTSLVFYVEEILHGKLNSRDSISSSTSIF